MTDRYVVVGAGGTGTHLIPPLLTYLSAYYGGSDKNIWQLGVIDGDSVEKKNFDRQLFEPFTINDNKASASIGPYKHMNNLVAIKEYLGAENISRYITEGSTVLICVDNFPVRALIEDHALSLNDVTIINGGNEWDTGSCQIWVRRNGKNETPPISFLHPEIRQPGENRAEMSCQQIAELPGGGQLISANMASAMHMLNALIAVHADNIQWTELQFNLAKGETYGVDLRSRLGWA